MCVIAYFCLLSAPIDVSIALITLLVALIYIAFIVYRTWQLSSWNLKQKDMEIMCKIKGNLCLQLYDYMIYFMRVFVIIIFSHQYYVRDIVMLTQHLGS